jgi:hypothetical protein
MALLTKLVLVLCSHLVMHSVLHYSSTQVWPQNGFRGDPGACHALDLIFVFARQARPLSFSLFLFYLVRSPSRALGMLYTIPSLATKRFLGKSSRLPFIGPDFRACRCFCPPSRSYGCAATRSCIMSCIAAQIQVWLQTGF